MTAVGAGRVVGIRTAAGTDTGTNGGDDGICNGA